MLELTEVSGIGKSLAEKLVATGINSIEKMASISLQDLLKVNGIGKSTGLKYIESAKELLKRKKEQQKGTISSHVIKDQQLIKKVPHETIDKKKEEIYKREERYQKPIKKQRSIRKGPQKAIEKKKEEIYKRGERYQKPIKEQRSIRKGPQKAIEKKKIDIYKRRVPYKKPLSSKSKPIQKQRPIAKTSEKKNIQQKSDKLPIKTFFPVEIMQRIRFLHFKIRSLEEALKKKEDFSLDELGHVLDYVKILNINYKTQSQIKIFRELNITLSFYDPLENREIKIWDLMFECTRVLWLLAKAYNRLSKKFEAEKKMKNAIIAMVECSKIYKTAAYFSSACTRQENIGLSLSAEELELNSEEARISAQNLAVIREENKQNLFLASQMYAGLSALSKRFYFLKEHDKIKKQHLKAQFNYDMGKACYLRAKALLRSSIVLENEEKIKKLKQKSNYYFSKAEEKWETLLKKSDNLSKAEIDNLKVNVSIVNENIIENDVEILNYNDTKNIQNPEPFIAVPENLGLFLPRSTMYLTKYRPRDLNFDRFKEYKISKLDLDSRHSKIEKLFNKKAGIGRTIKQLKFLYDKNDIDINIFFELLEKYEIKLEMVESTLEKLKEADKPRQVDKKRAEQGKVTVFHS